MTRVAAQSGPLVSGQVLDGKYKVGKTLGSGAMGIVYEGYHSLLQKAVAIKVLKPEFAAIEETRGRFEAEARATAALGHPHIVSVTDMGMTPDGALYIVMDKLRGETLGQRLKRVGKLDVKSACRIALDVLAGLEAAHALKLVHRDLKPDNIFLALPPGGREIAKILDFGIAKALASVGRRTQETKIGFTVGTPMYMSPEQATAAPDVDHRADIWAMGVIFYEMLTGREPFRAADSVEVLSLIISTDPPSLAEQCPSAPPDLVKLIESALNRKREHRPPSAAIFLARIEDTVAGVVSGLISRATFDPEVSRTNVVPNLNALNAPVLVDLSGTEIDVKPVVVAAPVPVVPVPAAPAQPPILNITFEVTPAPTPTPSVRDARMLAPRPSSDKGPQSKKPPRPKPLPWGRMARVGRFVVAIPLLLGLVVALGPKLKELWKYKDNPAALFGIDQNPAVATSAVEMVNIRFDVTPKTSALYLDGVPLASNPIALKKGDVHTITAVAEGFEIAVEKFQVGPPRAILLTLETKPPR